MIAAARGNVRDVRHERNRRTIPLNTTLVEVDVETQGERHLEALLEAIKKAGYEVKA